MVLVIDQASKFWVKTNMYLDQSYTVFGDWFFIHFIENPGMAFGLELGGQFGKLLLSLFRIVAVIFIAFYLRTLTRHNAHPGFVVAVSLVLAGALGNVIDSMFYGLIFSASPPFSTETAVLFPEGGGYAGFLQGHVVDMLYFPIIDTHWPDWVPVIGGDRFRFFRPIFNVADSSITIGMAMILLNQRKYFGSVEKGKEPEGAKEEEAIRAESVSTNADNA